ncbi:hypothetical protein RF683_06600 [Flavobacterium sp. 20NA77.7]|uniref:YhhN-like protein n=1 Tax=Flavobacterium nakdongensis TaxID=3073563 RepID=A0ABY9R8T0_9FLAO|nr:hypothetical protein [Flavobacterium sp. 20NA77.7]WMW77164.1 hypothetical protein RF683_06600 [Flavobacterium sp. 20NA77.7]
MSNKLTLVQIYFLIAIVYVIASLWHIENLKLLSEPALLPVIYFYYMEEIKVKPSQFVLFSVCLFFIGDMLSLVSEEDYYIQSLFFLLIPYMLLLNKLVKDFIKLVKQYKWSILNFSVLVTIVLLFYLFFSVVNLLTIRDVVEQYIIYVFGLTLVFLAIISTLLFMFNDSKSNVYMMLAVITFVVSDLFFIFNKKIDTNVIFLFLNTIAQVVSYFFYMKYFILKSEKR